jgi:beta-glucosidase
MISKQLLAVLLLGSSQIAMAAGPVDRPWLDPNFPVETRTDMVLDAMTQDEKFHYLSTHFGARFEGGPPSMDRPPPAGALGTPGYLPALERLGLPPLHEVDGPLGIANTNNMRPGDTATPLPAGILTAATWNPSLAFDGGAMIAREARSKGFNVLLAGGVNLAREPRNGRNFEYAGEDPLLAGTITGASVRGIQSEHIISTIKHYAVNDQETGRNSLSANMDEAALRESDLLAFEIAIEQGRPGSIMCGYNRVNGEHACENDFLLNRVLKRDWNYRGWVMSDFGGVHSAAKAALAGLDQQSALEIDDQPHFGAPLKAAVAQGKVPQSRIDDMARRVLRAMFASGIVDDNPQPGGSIDIEGNAAVAKKIADEGIVLLKNQDVGGRPVLPLSPRQTGTILIVGGHADAGVMSGGASQVVPFGGPGLVLRDNKPVDLASDHFFQSVTIFDPSPPLAAIRRGAPGAAIVFDDGTDVTRTVELARKADIVVVFATKWAQEGRDNADLSLPYGQDDLISAVGGANRKTIVVLETGNPVKMPWLDRVSGLIEAWYPGARGGEAIADVLFGEVNPSGKLPITFPMSEVQLPDPQSPARWAEVARQGANPFRGNPFDVAYREGAAAGYKWFDQEKQKPLFPFGYGLSYTNFSIDRLLIKTPQSPAVTFRVRNTGKRTGAAVAQVYVIPPGAHGLPRLVGFAKPSLQPGEEKQISLAVDRRLLANFDVSRRKWKIEGGTYTFIVGQSFEDRAQTARSELRQEFIEP